MKKPILSVAQKQYGRILISMVIVVIFGVLGRGIYNKIMTANGAWPVIDGGVYTSAVTRGGVISLVPGDQLYDRGVGEAGIPALTNPKYDSVSASEGVIADDLLGIDLALNGEHRFYPVQILNWHGAVNDTWGGKDMTVTYCLFCGTGIVYERNIDSQVDDVLAETTVTTFYATGQVYNNNAILKDSTTGSLWVQGLGKAVQGPLIGQSLSVIPSKMVSWKYWKTAYPSGLVLSTDTGFTRDYKHHPYGNYDASKGLFFPVNHTDPNLTTKAIVYGVTDGTNGIGFWDTILAGTGMTQTKLGDKQIVALYDFDAKIIRVFEATSYKGIAHTFTFDFTKKRLTDETGASWNMFGEQITGENKGDSLPELSGERGYWFCLSSLSPTWTANLGVATE